jgi:hypothetical protein
MRSVQPRITELCALVPQASDQILTHTSDANNMNVWLILSAQLLLHVKMKNVLIPANVQGMQTVHPEITVEFVLANLDLLEIPMV